MHRGRLRTTVPDGDQDEDIFICFDYEPDSSNIDGKAVLKKMQDYLDKKYGKTRH